jgi:hypothetical protein
VRIALLLALAFLGLTGCATIKSWFEPASPPPAQASQPPARIDQAPARAAEPPRADQSPRGDQSDEAAPRAAAPPVAPAPRVTPPPAPRPSTPAPAAPAATPPPAPAPPPDAQPPVLSPVLSAADEQKLRAETQQRLDGAEQRLRQIDPAKLASAQQDSLRTVQSFLDKAREALQVKDIQRAFTLADKAFVLADELTKRPR